MTLQTLILPDNLIDPLYIKELDELRREVEIKRDGGDSGTGSLSPLSRGIVYSFGTYYNAFVPAKWLRLTPVKDITVVIRATGKLRIQIFNSTGVYDVAGGVRHSAKCEIDARVIVRKKKDYIEYIAELTKSDCDGIIYPVIEALEDCELVGGAYITPTPVDARKVRTVAVLNYNKDAKVTQRNIDTVRNFKGMDIPVVVCDMTGNLAENTFSATGERVPCRAGVNEVNIVKKDATRNPSPCRGACANIAFDYIKEHYGDRTHAVMIDNNVELSKHSIERLLRFLMAVDNFREDIIVQGDVLVATRNPSPCRTIDGSGYVDRPTKQIKRFSGFDMNETDDVVALLSNEEIDYFKWGLICIPLDESRFNPMIRSSVELNYYLKYKPLDMINLNGFTGEKTGKTEEPIVKRYYYKYRDDAIASIDTDLELGKIPFRNYIDGEFKREISAGNIELAWTIIDAINDFLWGPEILEAEARTEQRISDLSKKLNESIFKRKGAVKDRIRLEQEYSKLYQRIDAKYDMIVEKWRETINERQ